MRESESITQLLSRIRQGDETAERELASIVYPELRKMARGIMSGERFDHTLQPTALVNEAYVRLAGMAQDLNNRAHFFAAAARVMRHVLVDYARLHRAAKRPGNRQRLDLKDNLMILESNVDLILDVERATEKLKEWDVRQYQIVELRFYGGMTEEEIAEVLEISARTVRRDWEMARAWLLGQLSAPPGQHDS
jgi:RNA polymerase sigma-70 factor (ECF subfamily)